MTDRDRSFDRLRRANPEPVRTIEDKPTAQEMLSTVQQRPAHEPPRPQRRGLLIAAAAAVVVLTVAIPVLLFLSSADEEPPVVTQPPTPTTIPQTTAPEITAEPQLAPLEEVIVGAWSSLWGTTEFNDDGTFRTSTGGVVRDRGTYQVTDDLLTFRSSGDSPDCPGLVESYTLAILSADRIAVTSGQEAADPDTCVDRLTLFDDALLQRTDPPTVAEALDAATQALIDTFVATYNAGDTDAFAAFLHPDFERLVTVDRDPRPQLLETVLTLYEVDAALNTEITLDCRPGTADAFCTPTRLDDLHRVLGSPASEDYGWGLTFEDGLLRNWAETRPLIPSSAYELEAVQPFRDWVVTNTELDPVGFEQLYTSGNQQTWVAREGIATDVAALVADWAADLGVTLEE